MNLQNNTILITGGTGGFGYAFASRLLAMGNTVIITGRNEGKLQKVKRKLPEVHVIQSDVTQVEDVKNLYRQVMQQFPDLNILINNEGEMRKIILQQEQDLTDITRELEINLMGRVQLKNTDIRVIDLVAPGSSTPLNDKFKSEDGFNPKRLMAPEKIVDAAIKGIQKNKDEIFPGLAKVMRIMSRLAPKLMISQAGKMGASFMYGN